MGSERLPRVCDTAVLDRLWMSLRLRLHHKPVEAGRESAVLTHSHPLAPIGLSSFEKVVA